MRRVLFLLFLACVSFNAWAVEKPADTFVSRPDTKPKPAAVPEKPVSPCEQTCRNRNSDGTAYCRKEGGENMTECIRSAMGKFDRCLQDCAVSLKS